MSLDPNIAGMLAELNGSGQPDMGSLPPAIIRQVLHDSCLAMEGPPDAVARVRRDINLTGASGPLPARLYTPAGAPPVGPCLLFFHGGGFVAGDLDSHDGFCRRFAALSGLRVLSASYRLAPEHPFPAAHDDVLAVLRQVLAGQADPSIDPAHLAVGGDSAGGNLAASAVLDVANDQGPRPRLLLAIYPVVQFTHETESLRRCGEGYLLTRASMDAFTAMTFPDPESRGNRRANLLARPDLMEAPATLVVTAGYDPLMDEGCDLALALRRAGVPVAHHHHPALIHAFIHMSGVTPAVPQAIAKMAAFAKVAVGG
ncbi:alpha/beta hydrolase fold domain-containing protein [Niveispirillum sp. SYP-B3756]|uniref:alpha/beta hydrolase n=1 Tax=Niveispirillum sp. SYP-B3756 TaxID=2662178 RepID=UPI001291A94F|nr:alpha/beta hydrolase [Niveispirillum sp. SYP-B3756]MQP67276.1 alpha/beta hydrolase fold domain-containing protein [Niveispirillum sp. SYP-B3756]